MRKINLKKVLFGLSVSLILTMAIGSFALSEAQTPTTPTNPRASEPRSVAATTEYGDFNVTGDDDGTVSFSDPVLTISGGTHTISMAAGKTSTTQCIEVINEATDITLNGVNIAATDGAALKIEDNATFDVTITLAGENTLKGKEGNYDDLISGDSGIEKNDDGSVETQNLGTLTINGEGNLTAIGGVYVAGIGGGDGGNGSDITINGGEVAATGGVGAAGIGGGRKGNGSNIEISGGVVTATGGSGAAGIGCGLQGSGSNITISGGKVTATGGEYGGAGIGGGLQGSGSNITISDGVVTATGGSNGAGIGGGSQENGSNIEISGGTVTATGGNYGAGIGGGYGKSGAGTGSGSNIEISGGVVTATGGGGGAGIGGGNNGSGSNIEISGGVVKATGGYVEVLSVKDRGAGIGGGDAGSGSDNRLNGDAVMFAASGGTDKAALEGFDSGMIHGIAFTGIAKWTAGSPKITWNESGIIYENVILSQDLKIPANLTVPEGQVLSIKEGKEVTLSEETGVKYTINGEIKNNGTLAFPADLAFGANGKITTQLTCDPQGGTLAANDGDYVIYQTESGVQKYGTLPTPTRTGYTFDGWYTDKEGRGTNVTEDSDVELNQHTLYANWEANDYNVTIETLTHGTITSDPSDTAKTDATVTLTVTPDTGYSLKANSLKVTTDDGNLVDVSSSGSVYTFIMPADNVTVSAEFEANEYNVTIETMTHGIITSDTSTAQYGGTVTLTVTSATGYSLKADSLEVTKDDGNLVDVSGSGETYTFTMPADNVTVSAEFEANDYNVTIETLTGGTITSDPSGTAKTDATVTLTVTPDTGHSFVDGSLRVTAGSGSVPTTKWKDGKYTFTMPAEDVTVSAAFDKNSYEVTIDKQNGSKPEKQTVLYGDTVTKPADPTRDGYSFVDWYTNAYGTGNPYDFSAPVESSFTIYAKWLGDEHHVVVPTEADEHGKITTDPEDPRTGDTVILTATPDEGYQVKGLPKVKILRQNEKLLAAKSGNDIGDIDVTPIGNNQYSFVMPNGNVEISAEFEAIPEPTPTPTPTPTPDPSVDPDGGSGGGASSKTGDPFMGGAALALLGIATTGVILTRKRK